MSDKSTKNHKETVDKLKELILTGVDSEGKSVAAEVEEYVSSTKAWFTLNSVYQALGVTTQKHVKDRKNVRMKVLRMEKKGILEHHGRDEGKYRLILTEKKRMKWWEGEEGEVPIKLPFNLHKYVKIYPGNIILISGKKNAGKSAVLLNIIRDNINNKELFKYYEKYINPPDDLLFNFLNCETGDTELKNRIRPLVKDNLQDWIEKVDWVECTHSYAQMMQKNSINLLDYLDAKEDPFKMKSYMDAIHNTIIGNKGIAIVARQLIEKEVKGKKILSGYGGEYVKNKPRLVLQLTDGALLVEDVKNPREKEGGGSEDINGWTARFILKNGHEFEITKELGPQMYNPLNQRWE